MPESEESPTLNGDSLAATPPRAKRQRKPPARQEVKMPDAAPMVPAVQPVCPDGHPVSAAMRFCPACGKQVTVPGPPVCLNGHKVTVPQAAFCPTCGVSMDAASVSESGAVTVTRPRPDSELTEDERAERARLHAQAVRLGQQNPAMQYIPGAAPSGVKTVIIHVLVDGFGAFGVVWMRGQEMELWPGHPRWAEARDWILLDTAGQYARWGRQMFGNGPWPGERSYTAAAGRFQQLRSLEGDRDLPQPTEEELARADEAERRRGRRVPMPLQ